MGTTTTTTVSTTTLESVVEKIIESDNEIDDAAEIEQHDENTEHEEHDNDKNCHKCQKAKFRIKNGDFCKMKCPNEMDEEIVENETTTEVVEETTDGEYRLGPLGSLLKFFVVTNTWGQAEPSVVEV